MKFFNIPEGPTVCQANGSGKIFCRQIGLFKIVPRQRGSNVLQLTSDFKKKRYPDDELKKYKARFCVRGDQQIEGVVYNGMDWLW